MKKLIILLLVLTLVLGVFASCNKRYLQIDDETSSSSSESIYETSSEETSTTVTSVEHTSESTFEETNETPKTFDTVVTVETIESIDGTEAGGTTEPINNTVYPNEYNYTLEKIGDQWYMIFDTYVDNPKYPLSYVYFEIDSMETIKQMIFNNELDQEQKRSIVTVCKRDEIGIPLPDILNPILPSNLRIYQAFLEGGRFLVSFIDKNSPNTGIDGAMYDLDEAGFIEKYNAAAAENIYVSEDGAKTIVLQQIKNQYIDRDYLYVKIGDNYALFVLDGTPDHLDRDLIMSFGFEVLT
ncbi:MAG: hypothetical protein IKL59_03140 [Clostridia bacterium]|nr:hypothetical protein [Clostridia bacterium]